MSPPLVYIELGTHHGVMTSKFLAAAPAGTECHLFEPYTKSFAVLRTKFGKLPNVHLHNMAVSDTNGSTKLFLGSRRLGGSDLGNSIYRSKGNVGDAFETVKCVEFSEWFKATFAAAPEDTVFVLKMNIEGAELNIYRSIYRSGVINRIKFMFVTNIAGDIHKCSAIAHLAHEVNATMKSFKHKFRFYKPDDRDSNPFASIMEQ